MVLLHVLYTLLKWFPLTKIPVTFIKEIQKSSSANSNYTPFYLIMLLWVLMLMTNMTRRWHHIVDSAGTHMRAMQKVSELHCFIFLNTYCVILYINNDNSTNNQCLKTTKNIQETKGLKGEPLNSCWSCADFWQQLKKQRQLHPH